MKCSFVRLFLLRCLAAGSFCCHGVVPEGDPVQLDPGRYDLRPIGRVSQEEQQALTLCLSRFSSRIQRDDFSEIEQFLRGFPQGAWTPAVRLRLAEEFYDTGWYSRSLRTLEELWAERGQNPAPGAAVFSTHVGVQLVELYARLGRREDVSSLMDQLRGATVAPDDLETLRGVEQGLATMNRRPEVSFRCGALALERIRVFLGTTNGGHSAILNSTSSPLGMSLADVANLSRQMGMKYQMAFRSPGAARVTPAVAHLKIGHFVSLLREHRGQVQVEDPTGWQSVFASRAALDSEASGYFLVPEGALQPGWRRVEPAEGATVWGRNGVLDNDPDGSGKRDRKARCGGGQGGSSFGMATWDVHLMLVSQQVIDTPLRYEPPIGPPIEVTFRHTQRANRRFGYRPTWTHNWGGQIYENPRTPLGDLWIHEEGGWERFSPLDEEGKAYQGRIFNTGRLQRLDSKTILWQFPDGTARTYSTFSDTNVAWGRIFYLSSVSDAAGNQVKIGLLPSGRVESLTDALGQVTRFYYELTDPGLPPAGPSGAVTSNFEFSNQVTRVVDPFGRSAQLQYAKVIRTVTGICLDPSGSYDCPFYYYSYDLTNIIDMGSLSSQFAYDPPGLVVTNLTTPYGSTQFKWMSQGGGDYSLDITDAEGDTERIQFSPYGAGGIDPALWKRPQGMRTDGWGALVAHWDKQAYAQSLRKDSLEGATLYMFQMSETLSSAGRVLMAMKKPLENPVWYNYPGQGAPLLPGIGDHPTYVGQVLDDGSTQLWRTDRDAWGNLTQSEDPVGRTTRFVYAPNFVDLLEARQVVSGQEEVLLRLTWNDQHLPLTSTDAASQVTSFTYNGRGQLTLLTAPLNQVTQFTYDTNGYLTEIDGPLPGTQDRNTFSYDPFGRVHTATDGEGYQVSLEYDSMDRLTRISFPDGTSETVVYDRMEPGLLRDRMGKETRFTYDALRRITAVQDALGRVTRFQWCGCGNLSAVIDPLGRLTQWHRDLQGRVIAKEYADGSRVSYQYEQATSRLLRRLDEKGQVTEFSYNLANQVLAKRYPNALRATPDVHFTYDPYYQRVASMTDADGLSTYQYYPANGKPGAGRLASVDGPWANDVVQYTYDESGRLIQRSIQGVAVRWTYDAGGRLTQLTNALGTLDHSWEAGSDRLSAVTYPNGQRSDYAYAGNTGDRLLQRITHTAPGGSKISEFTYTHDSLDRITQWTQLQAGRSKTWTLAYDIANRLTNVVQLIAPNSATTYSWVLDDADNRTAEFMNNLRNDFVHNSLNQLVDFNSGAVAGSVGFEWDAENRLSAITNGTRRVDFGYDGLGRRTHIVERDGGVVMSDRRYLWCGLNLCEERDGSGGTVLKRYSYYGLQNLLAPELAPGKYFVTRDHLGSIREIAGQTTTAFDYSPYGEQVALSGSLAADFGFTGHFQNRSTATLLAPFRAYAPALARWLSRDPQGEAGGLNLYAYAELDPVNRLDRLGYDWSLPTRGSISAWVDRHPTISKLVKKAFQKTKVGKVEKELEEFDEQSEKILDTELEVKEALDEPDCGTSGAGLLRTILDWIPKSVQLGPINNADLYRKTLDEGEKNVNAYTDKLNQRTAEALAGERN